LRFHNIIPFYVAYTTLDRWRQDLGGNFGGWYVQLRIFL
jgi:hypothetical protein